MNGVVVKQPDKGLGYDFETTYSDDTKRVRQGRLYITPLFTVEAFSYTATNLTKEEMSEILQIIVPGKPFELYYLSPFYGVWRDAEFYVGKGSLSIGRWNPDEELYESLSFNMIGVNPI